MAGLIRWNLRRVLIGQVPMENWKKSPPFGVKSLSHKFFSQTEPIRYNLTPNLSLGFHMDSGASN